MIMASNGFWPVTEDDLRPRTALVMVDVGRLASYGKFPKKIGENGTSLIRLSKTPVGANPRIPSQSVVFYQLTENVSGRTDFLSLEEFLLNHYDPKHSTAELRFYIRK